MKKIYILLTKTKTGPSRLIHFFTRADYTHASISLLPQTDEFYSYARLKPAFFIPAGLISENLRTGIFAKYPDSNCILISLDVPDDAYSKAEYLLKYHIDNRKKCKYNFFFVIPNALGIKICRKFRLTCAQFVAKILFESGAAKLPKDPVFMLPADFLKLENKKILFKGKIRDCHFGSDNFSEPN